MDISVIEESPITIVKAMLSDPNDFYFFIKFITIQYKLGR